MRVVVDRDGFASFSGRPQLVEPGPLYRPEVGPQLIKAARANPIHEGVQVWGPPDVNGPGGWGIYPHIGYWIDCPVGRYAAMRAITGYWNRFNGFGPYKAVDDAHLGRVGHMVSYLAHTEPFARDFADRIMARLEARWLPGVPGHGKSNMLKWGVVDILEHYPPNQGCSELGRPFAHALIFAVEHAIRTGDDSLAFQLLSMAHHCQDPSGAVYLIRPYNPAFPEIEDTAYKKKLKAKDAQLEAIERAGSPPFQIPFEEQLTLHGVEHYCAFFKAAPWILDLREGLRCMGPFPREVRFPHMPDLDHPKMTAWGHAMAPFKDLFGLDPIHQITNYPIGDGAGGAIHPDLYPSTR